MRLFAKKKNNKKAHKNKSGMDWARDFVVMPYDSVSLRKVAELICGTYKGVLGTALHDTLVGTPDIPKALWRVPFPVIVADDNVNCTAILRYVNAAACEALNATHDELTGLPTTLPTVMAGSKKYESKYEKKIGNVTLRAGRRAQLSIVRVMDGEFRSDPCGVAYAFDSWTLASQPGWVFEAGGEKRAPPPDPVDEGDLVIQITAQASLVRQLKEEQGLSNKDPQVLEAVHELLRLKALQPAD